MTPAYPIAASTDISVGDIQVNVVGKSPEDAVAYLAALRKAGRYQADVY